MVLFNAGKLPYRKLVSIRGVEELLDIEVTETQVAIGAAVTYSRIRQHSILRDEFPLLCSAASWTGSVANQNRGTIGGNIVNASPAADSAPALLVYDAQLELSGERGLRRIPYRDFHLGYRQTQIRDDELLRAIYVPRTMASWRQYSRKVGPRKAQAISKVCFVAAAQIENGAIRDVRVAVGSVAPTPLRCYKTETALRGLTISTSLIERAASTISAEIQPITDIRSTEAYRRAVCANLLMDFLKSLQ